MSEREIERLKVKLALVAEAVDDVLRAYDINAKDANMSAVRQQVRDAILGTQSVVGMANEVIARQAPKFRLDYECLRDLPVDVVAALRDAVDPPQERDEALAEVERLKGNVAMAGKIVERFQVCRQDGEYTILLADVPMQVVRDRDCTDSFHTTAGALVRLASGVWLAASEAGGIPARLPLPRHLEQILLDKVVSTGGEVR